MFTLADITFFANGEYSDTSALIEAQKTSYIYLEHFSKNAAVTVIKHYTNSSIQINPVNGFRFFKASNRFGWISLDTIRFLKNLNPDIILVEGLIFPVQVICLKILLPRKLLFIAKHQAERPFKGIKRWLQVIADRRMNAYFFTSIANAQEWFEAGVITDYNKIHEIPATITSFSRLDKAESRQRTNMRGALNFLWVGRLNSNKDPLTVLKAFQKFVRNHNGATLHMIFQTEELLSDIKIIIASDIFLQESVVLHGYIKYDLLPYWYSAADFYISASYSEGGCTAILEAMACGCIPIVSSIPASLKMIGNGEYGLSFDPGNIIMLYNQLVAALHLPYAEFSQKTGTHFSSAYSPEAVAGQMAAVCTKLLHK